MDVNANRSEMLRSEKLQKKRLLWTMALYLVNIGVITILATNVLPGQNMWDIYGRIAWIPLGTLAVFAIRLIVETIRLNKTQQRLYGPKTPLFTKEV